MDNTQLPDIKHFGDRLRYVFDRMGIDPSRGVQTLAEKFDWSLEVVNGWLSAPTAPDLLVPVRIAQWADVDADWLVSWQYGLGTFEGNVNENDFEMSVEYLPHSR